MSGAACDSQIIPWDSSRSYMSRSVRAKVQQRLKQVPST